MKRAAYLHLMAAHYFRMWFPVMMACNGDHGRELEVMFTNPNRIKYDEVMRTIREESVRDADRALADAMLMSYHVGEALALTREAA